MSLAQSSGQYVLWYNTKLEIRMQLFNLEANPIIEVVQGCDLDHKSLVNERKHYFYQMHSTLLNIGVDRYLCKDLFHFSA
jgi:hypothetical protein